MMKPGTKILYWSSRRIGAVAEGHGIDLTSHAATVLSSPRFGFLPTISRQEAARPLSRLEQLKRIEDGLGDLIERGFASDSTFVFAAGRTTVNFAQVPLEPTPSRAVMFAELRPDSGTPVALCLFGSMDNFSEFLRNAKAPLEAGWTNSSLPAIIKCVAARCTDLSAEFSSRHGFAIEALKVATREGVFGDGRRPRNSRPWNRAFTFGDVPQVADWLAEIYLDVDLIAATGCTYNGYGRILVGAPLWIATPYLNRVRLYEDFERNDLDADAVRFGRIGDWFRYRRNRKVEGLREI
jgi:hypothetical protein